MSRLCGSAYQYLQKSKIPTNKFQRSLPRLKIPKLEKTCQRYLAALDPVFSEDKRLTRAQDVMRQFERGPAKSLHSSLLAYDKTVKHTSYINNFWFDMYLSSRIPLPLNFNPFLAYRDAPTSKGNNQIIRGTNLIVSAMRFKRSLDENVLEPEVFHLNPKKTANSSLYRNVISLTPDAIATYVSFAFKAFPLDMSQYKNLFNSTRIPKLEKDELFKADPNSNKHVVVLKGGRFFSFDVLDENGDLKSPENIYANLKYISKHKITVTDELSITELTTSNRDFWSKERDHLIQISPENRENLKHIDSALFVLCLDEVTFEEQQRIEAAHNFLHGCNPHGPLNRWFDKSFSIIITKDGHAAINFEHSWGDGVAILRFFNDTFNDSTKYPQLIDHPTDLEPPFVSTRKLDFHLDSRLRDSIAKCRKLHVDTTETLDLGVVEYAKLNKEYFKKNSLSPDSMSQLSFQLAFKKVYNKTPVTYESCSTAAFRGGRTETVRPCTNETNEAVNAIIKNRNSSVLSNDELKSMLKKCSLKHFQLCKEASMGDGFDRHLFGLKEMASKSGQKLPELFLDPIYLENQHYILSTSTLYGECFSGGGFAPVVPDGFGLGYGYVDANFGVLVSSYKKHRNNAQFVQALNESLDDIRRIVEA